VVGLPVLALAARVWVFSPYQVQSDAMAPALFHSEVVGIWKLAEPELGDIVACVPQGESAPGVKRVVAIGPAEVGPGPSGELLVNGSAAFGGSRTQGRLEGIDCAGAELMLQIERWGEQSGGVLAGGTAITAVEIPQGSLYLLGDNRPGSSDSRHLGPISDEQVLGVASRVLWSRDSCSGSMRWERMGEALR